MLSVGEDPVIDFKEPQNNPKNVQTILRVFNSNDYAYLFPAANSIFSYETVINAMALYPQFCNEVADIYSSTHDQDQMCRAELATLFAHITYQSRQPDPIEDYPEWRRGMYFVSECLCTPTDLSKT